MIAQPELRGNKKGICGCQCGRPIDMATVLQIFVEIGWVDTVRCTTATESNLEGTHGYCGENPKSRGCPLTNKEQSSGE